MLRHAVYQSVGPRSQMEDAAWMNNATRMVVCDGMGGHHRGDVASKALCAFAETASLDVIRAQAVEVVLNAAGYRAGTTCSVAELDGQTIRWLHAGDSALWLVTYLSGTTTIRRLTEDQSLWGAQRAAGTEALRLDRSTKSVLLSCVMAPESISWDEGEVTLPSAGKAWLFGTTDGFHEAFEGETGDVDPEKLVKGLRDIVTGSPADAQTWMDGCAAGTRDNATLAIWRVR